MSATNTGGWTFCQRSWEGILNAIGKAGSQLFDAVWSHVVNAWTRVKRFVVAHPRFTLALIVLVLGILLAQPVAKGIVVALGFGMPGVTVGSIAAKIQSALYGGFVPAGSIFSFLQSFGARS